MKFLPCNSQAVLWLIDNDQFFGRKRAHIPFCRDNLECGGVRFSDRWRCCREPSFPQSFYGPHFDVAEREGEQCVRRALEELEVVNRSHSDSATERDTEDEEKSFVDILRCMELEIGGESEGFSFADILQWAVMLSETNILEGVVDTSELLFCVQSSISLVSCLLE